VIASRRSETAAELSGKPSRLKFELVGNSKRQEKHAITDPGRAQNLSVASHCGGNCHDDSAQYLRNSEALATLFEKSGNYRVSTGSRVDSTLAGAR